MRNTTTRQPPPVAAAKAAARFFVVARVVVVATSVFFVRPVSWRTGGVFYELCERRRSHSPDGAAALENTGHYFGRLSEENVLEKLRLFNNDAEKEAGEVDATILLDQPRWDVSGRETDGKALVFFPRDQKKRRRRKRCCSRRDLADRTRERRRKNEAHRKRENRETPRKTRACEVACGIGTAIQATRR